MVTTDATADPMPSARAWHFVLFAAAQGISGIGTWMHKAAIGWLAWDLTHSPAWVGALALTDLIAALWVAPFAGAVTDRHNPLGLLLLTQTLLLAEAVLLAAIVLSGGLAIGGLLAMALIEATLQGFNQPVRMTAISHLATRERISQAIASNSIAFNLARILGPALAGALLLHDHVALVFMLNATSYVAMIAAIGMLRHQLDRPPAAPARRLGGDVIGGFRYIARSHRIAVLFAFAFVFSLFARPFIELYPAIAGGLLAGGPDMLAWLMGAQGVGAMVGAGLMLRRAKPEHLPVRTCLAGSGLAVTLILFALTRSPGAVIGLMVLAGFFHVVCNIGMQSLAQLSATPEYRGRTMALYGLLFRTTPAIGAFAIGIGAHLAPLNTLIGCAAAIGLGGMASIAIAARPLFFPSASSIPASAQSAGSVTP